VNVTGNISVIMDYDKLLFIAGNDHNFNSEKEIKKKNDRENSLNRDTYLFRIYDFKLKIVIRIFIRVYSQ